MSSLLSGILNYYGPAETTTVEESRAHWETNTLGPLILFQAVASLLKKSKNPQFSVISTAAGRLAITFRWVLPLSEFPRSR